MSKIRLALIVEALRGGVFRHVADIVENLNSDKFDIYLIYSDGYADPAFFDEIEELKKYAKLIRCNSMIRSLGLKDFLAFRDLKRILSEMKPDIVHCHSSKAGIVGRMAARCVGVRGILYTPNAYAFQNPNLPWAARRICILAERFLSRHATSMTINVSKEERLQALRYRLDEPDKFTLICNAISDKVIPSRQEARARLRLNEDGKYVGVTARCAGQKNPFEFLSIAEKVINRNSSIEFVYVGDGEYREAMQRWITEHLLQKKIHLIGYRSDASEIVGAFDVYLSTANYEGLPYSVLEAMRAGVVLVASDVEGNRDLVHDGENGWLYEPGNTEAATDRILGQFENHTIKKEQVREQFLKRGQMDRMINELGLLYEQCIRS